MLGNGNKKKAKIRGKMKIKILQLLYLTKMWQFYFLEMKNVCMLQIMRLSGLLIQQPLITLLLIRSSSHRTGHETLVL